jgi:F-type H+-transporting ATPase subunit b
MELFNLLNPSEIVVQIICFLLLFSFLRVFAWKRILGLLDERKARVAGEFRKIEEIKQSVEKLRWDYEAKLHAAGDEARARIQKAVAEGKDAAEGIKKEAQLGAQKILESARAQTRYEIVRAKAELKDEIVDLVLKATEQVIEEKLTPEGDRKIVEGFLKDIEKMP